MVEAVSSLSQVAATGDIPFCRGIVNGSYCAFPLDDHPKGFVADGVVHLADQQRTTTALLQRLCILAAELELGPIAGDSWEVIYQRDALAEQIARKRLRVRIPRQAWDLDRWTVRAQLAHVPTSHPLRAGAMAWTRLAGRV
jgi:hypothetical protein